MAKKSKLSTDKFDFDSELDNFGFDDFDSQINPEAKKGSKSRKVVTDVFRGSISGAKDEMKSPAFLKKLARDALPSSYGTIADAASSVTESTSQLYDEAVRELKPQLGRIAKKIDRLVPDERKTLKKMSSKLNSMFSGSEASSGPSREEVINQGVANAIGQVFGVQQDMQARSNAESRIRDQVDGKRFESNFGLLSSINEGVQRVSQYTEKVTQAYQKKSLELQYRSYFVQNELLNLTNKFYEVFKTQNEAIVKNTGLPDYLKITNTERLLQVGKNKFAERTNDFFLGPDSAIGRGMKKITDSGRGYLAGIKQGVESALMGIEMTADMAESLRDMGMTKSELAGNAIGAKGINWVSDLLSKRLKNFTENSPRFKRGRDALNTGANTLKNVPGKIDSYQKTDDYKKLIEKLGIAGPVAEFLFGAFKDDKPDLNIKNPNSVASLNLGGKFDVRTQRSIVDIIPGYLSRILREITVFRTGDEKTPLTMYDFTKGKFATKGEIGKSINQEFNKKINSSVQGFRLNQLTNQVMGGDKLDAKAEASIKKFFDTVKSDRSIEQSTSGMLSSKQYAQLKKKDPKVAAIIEKQLKGELNAYNNGDDKAVKKFFLDISKISNFDYTPENLLSSDEYTSLAKSNPKAARFIKHYLDKEVTNNANKTGGQLDLTSAMSNVRSSTPDIRYQIENFIQLGYGEILEEQGVIKVNADGDYDIDEKAYHKLVDSEIIGSDKNIKRNIKPTRLVKSDINAKRNISSFSPKKALEATKKTKIFDWFYKLGKGDQQKHTGPMAQDVNRHMGEDAAPGGTTLDLTTMNGNNMAAIQALSDKQDSMLGGEATALSVLKSIKEDSASIVELLKNSGSQHAGGGYASQKVDNSYTGILGSMFGPLGRLVGKGTGDFAKASVKTAGAVGTGMQMGAKGLNAIYDKVKDPAGQSIKWIMQTAGQTAMKALEVGGDLIFNKLPQGFRSLKDLGVWAKDKAKQLFARARDVYVKGQAEPAIKALLLKAGHYRDQATNQVIRNMADLKELKGNVINQAGEVVLTIEDAARGLVDINGEEIKTGLQSLALAAKGAAIAGITRGAKFLKGALLGGSSLIGKVADFIPTSLKSLFSGLQDIGLGSNRIYEVLTEMRDMMRGGAGMGAVDPTGTGQSGFVGPLPQSLTGKIKDSLKEKGPAALRKAAVLAKRQARLASRKGAKEGGGLIQNLKGKAAGLATGASAAIGSLKGSGEDKSAFNDTDGSGNRDGSWKDRLSNLAKGAGNRKAMLAADLKAQYRSSENVIDTMIGKVGQVMDMAKNGIGGIFGSAGDMLEGAGDILGTGKGKAGKGGILGKIGSVLTSPFKAAWGLTKGVSKGALGLGKLVLRGGGLLARGAAFAATNPSAVINGVRIAATAASLVTGGVGSAVFGTIGVGLTAIGSVLASPVVLGGLAAASVGYGAYELYKYYTRNDANEYYRIRLLQYGLRPEDKMYNEAIFALEGYLTDNRIGYDNGKAYILEKTVNNKDLITIFSIDENDQENCAKFAKWYRDRFKPFFLSFLTALFAVDKKMILQKVHKLSDADKIKLLGLVSFDGGPYRELTSPYKPLESLADTKDQTLALIKKLTDQLASKLKTATKGQAPMDTVNSATKATIAASPIRPVEATPVVKDIPAAKRVTDGGDPFQGEEGKETIVTKDSVRGGNGMPKLYLASGGLRDGSGADQYLKLAPGVSLSGLNPAMLKNLRAMVQEYGEATGKAVTITSGSRTSAQQQLLYNKNPRKAAKPGTSLHEFGLAIDADSDDLDAMDKAGLMRKYGFMRPVGGEPWHMEAIGIQGNLQLAKRDASFAEQAVAASLFKGGGGAGTMDGVPLGRRDPELAMAILNNGSAQTVNSSDKDRIQAALKPVTGKAANDPSYKAGSIASTMQANSQVSKYMPAVNKPQPTPSLLLGTDSPQGNVTAASSGFDPVNPNDREAVKGAIMAIASKAGSDPNEAAVIAAVESSMNPNARSIRGSAAGPFQFVSDTWKEQMGKHARKHGLDPNTPPTDITASTLMATEYFKETRKAISSVKSNPNITDVYIAHLLGPTGGRRFLSADPNAVGAQLFPEASRRNPEIFFTSGRALTIAEIYSKIDAKLGKAAKDYGISIPTGNAMGTPTLVATSTATQTATSAPVASTVRRSVFSAPTATVISSPSSSTMQQTSSTATSEFAGMNDTLLRQLDVQTQMRDLLKNIADKISPAAVSNGYQNASSSANNPTPPVNNRGVKTVDSAIDLRRKVA